MSDEEYEVEKVLDKRVKKGGQVITVLVFKKRTITQPNENVL